MRDCYMAEERPGISSHIHGHIHERYLIYFLIMSYFLKIFWPTRARAGGFGSTQQRPLPSLNLDIFLIEVLNLLRKFFQIRL